MLIAPGAMIVSGTPRTTAFAICIGVVIPMSIAPALTASAIWLPLVKTCKSIVSPTLAKMPASSAK